jgi:hypothetical protein
MYARATAYSITADGKAAGVARLSDFFSWWLCCAWRRVGGGLSLVAGMRRHAALDVGATRTVRAGRADGPDGAGAPAA